MEKPDGGLIEFPKQNQTQNITLTAAELQRLIREAVKQSKTKVEKPKLTRSRYKTNGIKKAHAAEPLYSPEDFKALANYFLNSESKHAKRNYMLLVFGCTVGDRGGDLLNAKIKDVVNSDGTIKDYYETYEQKTGKYNKNKLTEGCKKAIEMYLKSLNGDYNFSDYLIKSQKNGRMSIQQMWRILNKAASEVGLSQNIGTHTLRKTYGYTARKTSNENVMDILQSKYKHSDQRITKTYLGITQDEIDKLADDIDKELQNALNL